MSAWILAIDFGTSYTVAAVRRGDAPPEVIEIGGERRIPSVILVDRDGSVVVGRTADDLSGSQPSRTLRAVKSRLGDQTPVVLDGRPHQAVDLVAALLAQVVTDTTRQMGGPPSEVRLTHPATWNRPRINRLVEAAAKAGIGDPGLVPEPVAAALSYAAEAGVPQGSHVVVYDLGGGTFDSAVVTAVGSGFAIVGRPSGDQHIGGELFDEMLMNEIGETLPPDAWDNIQVGEDPTWQQVASRLRNEVRKAKETLSSHPYADVVVPLPDGLVQRRLTREQFEELVRPYIAETVELLKRCLDDAGVESATLAGISLVGGSSRSPIVEQMVAEAFPGVPVSRRGDPKTAVASGAARAVRASAAAPGGTGAGSLDTARLASAPGVSTTDAPQPSVPSGVISSPPQPSTFAPPVVSQPSVPPAPISAPSVPPSSVLTDGGAGATSIPAPSLLPPAVDNPTVSNIGDGQPAVSSAQRRSRLPIIVGAVVAAAAVLAAVLLLRPDDKPSVTAGPPTREQIAEALLDQRDVERELGDGYAPGQATFIGTNFCNATARVDQLRDAVAPFAKPDSDLFFQQAITTYRTTDDLEIAFGQETTITESCSGFPYNFGGLDYTATLTDITDELRLDRGAIAVRVDGVAVDGSTLPFQTVIIEKSTTYSIVAVQLDVLNRDITAEEIDSLVDLSETAFEKAANL